MKDISDIIGLTITDPSTNITQKFQKLHHKGDKCALWTNLDTKQKIFLSDILSTINTYQKKIEWWTISIKGDWELFYFPS